MNDAERSQWIDNDEELYNAWKATKLSRRDFMRTQRALIDEHIQSHKDAKPEDLPAVSRASHHSG